jgi:hypothetical protein
MEATRSFKTLGTSHPMTQRHVSEVLNSQQHRCENLKPYMSTNLSVREGKYDLDFKNPNSDKSKWIDGLELTNLYLEFIKDFPVVSIEDPFDQDHWEAWTNITANTSIQVTLL